MIFQLICKVSFSTSPLSMSQLPAHNLKETEFPLTKISLVTPSISYFCTGRTTERSRHSRVVYWRCFIVREVCPQLELTAIQIQLLLGRWIKRWGALVPLLPTFWRFTAVLLRLSEIIQCEFHIEILIEFLTCIKIEINLENLTSELKSILKFQNKYWISNWGCSSENVYEIQSRFGFFTDDMKRIAYFVT